MIYYESELYHHGRKGMKWGQHIFGAAKSVSGKIKARKVKKQRQKALAKAREKKKINEQRMKDAVNGKINIKEMTDKELSARLARLSLENEVKKAEGKPEKSLKNVVVDDVVKPAAIAAGKNIVQGYLEDLAGIKVKDKGVISVQNNLLKKTGRKKDDDD